MKTMRRLQNFDFLWIRLLSANTLHNFRPLSLGTLGFPQAKLQLLANITIPWMLPWVRIFAITVLDLNHVNQILARSVSLTLAIRLCGKLKVTFQRVL